MIYISRKADSEKEANLFVEVKGRCIVLKLSVNKTYYEYVISRDSSEKKPEIVHLGFSMSKGIYKFTATECRESRSGLPFILETNAGHCMFSMSNFGGFFIPEDESEDISIFINAHCNVFVDNLKKSQYKIVEGYTSSNIVFYDLVPSSRKYIKRLDAKRNLLKNINELDSLAMIEAQLDLLTRYVLTGHGRELLEAATNNNMVTSIHSDSKLIKTISDQKNHLRKIQREYFLDRDGGEDGNI